MHLIIVAVEAVSKNKSLASGNYSEFLSDIESASPLATDKRRWSENLWLLHAENDLPLLGRLIQAAETQRVVYRVLFVEKATEYRSNPKSVNPAS